MKIKIHQGPRLTTPSAAWRRAVDGRHGRACGSGSIGAPRAHRFLAWQILHATLMCGLRRVSQLSRCGQARWNDVVEHALCQVPVCADAGIHEGILHILLECPVAQRMTAWVCSLWTAVVGGRTPPRSAAVSLLGDRRAWDPGGGGLCELWYIVSWLPYSSCGMCGARHGSTAARPLRVLWWLPLLFICENASGMIRYAPTRLP